MSGLQLEQVRHRADVVLVAVREHDADDVVEPVPDRLEVGQDQVDAGLVLLGEEHAAVDDEELAVDTRTTVMLRPISPSPPMRRDAQSARRRVRAES